EERAERKRHAKHFGSAECRSQRQGEDRETEELPRSGVRHIVQQKRNELSACDQHEDDEDSDLRKGEAEDARNMERIEDAAPIDPGERRHKDEDEDHDAVFDDEPSDRNASALALEISPLLERA